MLDMDILDRYYLRLEPQRYVNKVPGSLGKVIASTARKARKRTSARVFERIMETGPDGRLHLGRTRHCCSVDVTHEDELIHAFRQYLSPASRPISPWCCRTSGDRYRVAGGRGRKRGEPAISSS